MTKLKGLGKGLDALFSASNVTPMSIINTNINNKESKIQEYNGDIQYLQNIALTAIKANPYQPRKLFNTNELQELADSIAQNGVIQPIIVRKIIDSTTNIHNGIDNGNDNNSIIDSKNCKNIYYEIIAGERRWRASKIAKLENIPAIVREFNDEEALAIALIENIQRRDLSVIEEAKCYKRLIDEFNITHEQLAKVACRSRSHITNMLRLLNLQINVQDMLLNGQLTMGHARALLVLPQELQQSIAIEIIDDGLTTSQVETKVAKILATNQEETPAKINKISGLNHADPDISRLETTIADKLGMAVSIKHGRRGQGRLTISYSSLDELDNLLRLL